MGGERDRVESRPRARTPARVSDEVVRASDGSAAAHAGSGYALLDAGDGERLERWGAYRLRRPDARAVGLTRRLPAEVWRQADAHYRGEAGSGAWTRRTAVPERWLVTHDAVTFTVKLAPYKHTGLFPEQAAHWRWMRDVVARAQAARQLGPIASSHAHEPAHEPARESAADEVDVVDVPDAADAAHAAGEAPRADRLRAADHRREAVAHRPLRVLNLFAYTGGATIALAKAGCLVTHVDASKPALAWAKENARANDLPADAIRWIEDDAVAFVARELRRGRTYDAALLDPPSVGRAPKGRATSAAAGGGLWRLDEHLPALLADVHRLLRDPVFLLINDYARDADAESLAWLVQQTMQSGAATTAAAAHNAQQHTGRRSEREATRAAGEVEAGRLSLEIADGRRLETGVFARWRADAGR